MIDLLSTGKFQFSVKSQFGHKVNANFSMFLVIMSWEILAMDLSSWI